MKLAHVFVVALLAISRSALSADTYFPKDTLSNFEQTWYAQHLSAMKEPVLMQPPSDKDYFAFRVLYLPTWGHPVAVRVERRGRAIVRRAVMLSGDGGYDAGPIKEEHRANVPIAEFESLLDDIRRSGFWELPPEDDAIGLDGSHLIIEALDGERHVVLVRWTPEYDTEKRGLTGLVAFYRQLFQTSGLWEEK